MSNRPDNIVFAILQEHPSVAAGICTFAVAFALVAGNAIYAQSGNHPVPIWATRDNTTTQSIQETVYKPDVRPVEVTRVKPKHIPVPTARGAGSQAPAAVSAHDSELVTGIQAALVKSGDLKGEVDGKYGPATRNAIISYQARNGLKEDGEPSSGLLKVILLNQPVASTPVDSKKYDTALVYKIQSGLAKTVDPAITVDGIFGQQTASAISKFQKDNNLPVTGQPDSAVLKALIARNVVPQG